VKSRAPDTLRRNVIGRLNKRGDRAQLARSMGVAESTISTWLAGRNDLELARLDDVAAFLGVSVGELFDRTERDLPGQTGTGASPSQGETHDETAMDRLLAAAREAGRLEGNREALMQLADTLADEIERLTGESRTVETHTTRRPAVRRKSR
jgi:transcriptional regulator with XRE-family HTH domain